MDARSFDRLTRSIGARLTRRGALTALVGLAGVASSGGDAGATRRVCRPLGQKCLRNDQCCSARCDTARSTPRSRRNRCGCGALATCGQTCIDLAVDTDNCGACGHVCGAGFTCEDGACFCGASTCAAGEGCCGGTCTDLTHPANCAACGVICGMSDVCTAKGCVPMCEPPAESGTCTGSSRACYIDVAGVTHYVNTWWGPYDSPCSADDPCPAGSICTLFQSFSTGGATFNAAGECRPLVGAACVP